MADAWIGCWDAKYHYSFWRPVTAIQQGDTDGRSDTEGDPTWMPFRTTPNHPEYPGAHACVSTAASHALKRFFHRNRTSFRMESTIGDVTYVHTFERYTDAGAEARTARIYGGMHYEFSNEAGEKLGREVVDSMFAKGFFQREKGQGKRENQERRQRRETRLSLPFSLFPFSLISLSPSSASPAARTRRAPDHLPPADTDVHRART